MDSNDGAYVQKIEYARASLWAPFYAVGMAARIRGAVPAELVRDALRKLQLLYPPLASRAYFKDDGSAWLTTDGVGEFPLEVRLRTSGSDWTKIFLEQESRPFDIERGPAARFFLLRGDQVSDLVAIAPHVVCDGCSMTYVMADAVALLNDPDRPVTRAEPAPAVTWQTIPHSAGDNLLLRGLVRVANRAWPGQRLAVRQREYEELHRAYWTRQQNGALVFELTKEQTQDLLARCKQQGVSVTGALMAAFLLAQANGHSGPGAVRREVSIAVNIRDRMTQPVERATGVYVSSVDLRMRYRPGTPVWLLARESHARLHQALGDRPRIFRTLVLEELDPAIADSFLAALATGEWSRELKLITHFVKINGNNRRLNLSNIGRISLPDVGEPYRLETILPFPPLVPGDGLAVNVLTVDGRMNIITKFRRTELDEAAVTEIKERAFSYLYNGSPAGATGNQLQP